MSMINLYLSHICISMGAGEVDQEVGWVAPKIIMSAPVPFWVYRGWNWVGIGSGDIGDLGIED